MTTSSAAATPDTRPGEPSTVPCAAAVLGVLDLSELRAHRRDLLDELDRVLAWQRLVRARIDLVVAAVVGVEDVDVLLRGDELRSLVVGLQGGCPPATTATLPALRQAAAALRGYDGVVRARLAVATDELVNRYSREPLTCLGASPLAG